MTFQSFIALGIGNINFPKRYNHEGTKNTMGCEPSTIHEKRVNVRFSSYVIGTHGFYA